MSPLEKLFRLEIEYHRRVRALASVITDDGSLHTSFALQTGYESLLASLGRSPPATWKLCAAACCWPPTPRDLLATRDLNQAAPGNRPPRPLIRSQPVPLGKTPPP